jgi:hypothetical protein
MLGATLGPPQNSRRSVLSDLGIDAGKVDLLVEPSAGLILAGVGNEVREAADLLVLARL